MAKPVHVKITGWGGVRNIPKKQLDNFTKDVKAIRNVSGFSRNRQTVQLPKKMIPQLAEVVKKHGLKMEAPKPMSAGAIIGFD